MLSFAPSPWETQQWTVSVSCHMNSIPISFVHQYNYYSLLLQYSTWVLWVQSKFVATLAQKRHVIVWKPNWYQHTFCFQLFSKLNLCNKQNIYIRCHCWLWIRPSTLQLPAWDVWFSCGINPDANTSNFPPIKLSNKLHPVGLKCNNFTAMEEQIPVIEGGH